MRQVYTVPPDELEMLAEDLQLVVHRRLQVSRPFTGAFMGRITAVVPFLPMCNDDPDDHLLKGEMMAVAKLLIEREQDKISSGSELLHLNQTLTPSTKRSMRLLLLAEPSRRPESVPFRNESETTWARKFFMLDSSKAAEFKPAVTYATTLL